MSETGTTPNKMEVDYTVMNCRNCGLPIFLDNKHWRHFETGGMRCDLYATPQEDATHAR